MFVVDALARNFALELRKRQQHVEGKTTRAGGGVESSRHRDKRDVVFIEEFDQLGEVGKRPCQTIDLVDDDDIDLSSANVVQQLLPSGARLWNRPRSRRRHNDPGSASSPRGPGFGCRPPTPLADCRASLTPAPVHLGRDTSINCAA